MRKVTLHSYHITFDDVHSYRLIQKERSWIFQKKIFSCRLLLDPKSQLQWRKSVSIEILKLMLHLSFGFSHGCLKTRKQKQIIDNHINKLIYSIKWWIKFMSGSCHLDRASNVEIGVECQIFAIVIFFNCRFYNLGYIQGIIRVH